MKWFFKCFKQYADFRGRARRREYWIFGLIFSVILLILHTLWKSTTPDASTLEPHEALLTLLNPWYILYVIFVFGSTVPLLAVLVRRLHDTGRSGLWGLGIFIVSLAFGFITDLGSGILTVIASIVLIIYSFLIFVWTATDSQPGENKYGPNPKELPTTSSEPNNQQQINAE